MKYTHLNKDWNADPNAPYPKLSVEGTTISLEFYLNWMLYDGFKNGDKGKLIFKNCHKYCLNSMNDEGYYAGQYRYRQADLPWGQFYHIETDWKNDFPEKEIVVNSKINTSELKHYIFFFRDNTFECVVENYEFTQIDIDYFPVNSSLSEIPADSESKDRVRIDKKYNYTLWAGVATITPLLFGYFTEPNVHDLGGILILAMAVLYFLIAPVLFFKSLTLLLSRENDQRGKKRDIIHIITNCIFLLIWLSMLIIGMLIE